MKKYLIPAIILCFTATSCGSDEPPTPDNNDKTQAEAGYVPINIIEYAPAPGQFINELPEFQSGWGYTQILAAADKAINDGNLVSLGGWGGYIVYHLEKYIANKPGADFRIVGNAYHSFVSDNIQYGSCEPGIVYVMEDSNGNGRPDDVWYELCGSHTSRGTFETVTYSQHSCGNDTFEVTVNGPGDETQTWISNPEFHPHSYYPLWCAESTLKFTGRLLPANGKLMDNGQYSQECYSGYADAQPNNSEASALDISAATDADGNPVNLKRIDFIKVQTGILQTNGPIGECSTEVGRVQVL